MMKIMWFAMGIGTILLIKTIAPDLQRYIKIRSM